MRRTSLALTLAIFAGVASAQTYYTDFSNLDALGSQLYGGSTTTSTYTASPSVYSGFNVAGTSTGSYSGSLTTLSQTTSTTYYSLSDLSYLTSSMIENTSTTSGTVNWGSSTTYVAPTSTSSLTSTTSYVSGGYYSLSALGEGLTLSTLSSFSTSPYYSTYSTYSTPLYSANIDNPEPATLILTGSGLLGALLIRRRFRKAA